MIQACSTSHPSGNLVGGLPLVEHTGAGVIGQRVARDKSLTGHPISGSSSGFLWSIAVRLCMQVYIHMNLYSYQAACLYLHSTRRTPCGGAMFLVTRNGQKLMITKSTQAHSRLVLWSAGTFLSCIRRSLMVVADFHDMFEILISHTIIAVFHAHVVMTVSLQAALRVPRR